MTENENKLSPEDYSLSYLKASRGKMNYYPETTNVDQGRDLGIPVMDPTVDHSLNAPLKTYPMTGENPYLEPGCALGIEDSEAKQNAVNPVDPPTYAKQYPVSEEECANTNGCDDGTGEKEPYMMDVDLFMPPDEPIQSKPDIGDPEVLAKYMEDEQTKYYAEETTMLRVPLENPEIAKMGQELSEQTRTLADIKFKKKEQNRAYNTQIKDTEEEINSLCAHIDDGYMDRNVFCKVFLNRREKKRLYVLNGVLVKILPFYAQDFMFVSDTVEQEKQAQAMAPDESNLELL